MESPAILGVGKEKEIKGQKEIMGRGKQEKKQKEESERETGSDTQRTGW